MQTEIRKGNLDVFRGSAGIWKLLLVEYLNDEGVKVGFSLDEERGETDEPVTADIRRLIRCPGSLHGGSGFGVTPLTMKSLEEFDPLEDAVVFGDEPVFLGIQKSFSTQMRGESYPPSLLYFLKTRQNWLTRHERPAAILTDRTMPC